MFSPLAWVQHAHGPPKRVRGTGQLEGLTSTAAQLLPNSWGFVNSRFSGVLISLTVFRSKFPQRPPN